MDITQYGPMVRDWVEQLQKHRGRDAKKTLEYADKILHFGQETANDALKGLAYYYMGETFYMLNDVEAFYQNTMRGLECLQVSRQWELTAKALNLLGIVSSNQGNAPFALDYYLSGAAVCVRYGLTRIKSMIEYNIGTTYLYYGEYGRAFRYLENSREAFQALPEEDSDRRYMSTIYISLASCCLGSHKLKEADRYLKYAAEEYEKNPDSMAYLYLLSVEARFYNELPDIKRRDLSIRKLEERMNDELTVMEAFEDFYVYCRMLLEIGKYRELWQMLNILESIGKKSGLIHLQRKLLTLQIEYYKKIEDEKGYFTATALFYELSQIMEQEERYVIGALMNVRFSLEEARIRQREVEAENRLLQQKSERDVLTGISNRLWLNRFAGEALLRACDSKSYFALEILDVDYFKEYNDNYGHQLGDECLIAIAGELKKITERGRMFCARYGGDEFILLYEGYSPEEVKRLAEELQRRIQKLSIEHRYAKEQPVVTVSQGICCQIPEKEHEVRDFLRSADLQLYRVKKQNRNGIAIGPCEEED